MPFLYVPEQLRPCSASQAQFDDILRKLTSLRCELHVPDEQLGFVDSQHPGPSTAPSTDAVPTMYEQTVYRICPGRTPPSTVVHSRILNERVLLLSMLDEAAKHTVVRETGVESVSEVIKVLDRG